MLHNTQLIPARPLSRKCNTGLSKVHLHLANIIIVDVMHATQDHDDLGCMHDIHNDLKFTRHLTELLDTLTSIIM